MFFWIYRVYPNPHQPPQIIYRTWAPGCLSPGQMGPSCASPSSALATDELRTALLDPSIGKGAEPATWHHPCDCECDAYGMGILDGSDGWWFFDFFCGFELPINGSAQIQVKLHQRAIETLSFRNTQVYIFQTFPYCFQWNLANLITSNYHDHAIPPVPKPTASS